MELAFQTSPLHFLRCVVQEVLFQEETAETIVPDSYPDISAIIDCHAQVILRGKDCRDGSVTIAGGIKGAILYQPEGETAPRNLELYLPFSMKQEHPLLTSQSQVLCSLQIRSMDARIINSRKAMLRVNLGAQVSAYESTIEQLCSMTQDYPGLQTKTATYPVCLPLETGEKSFVLNDTLELGTHRPPIRQIVRFSCRPEISDQKLIGNKAIFKGSLNCRILYQSEDERLYLYQQMLPFSQYCDLQQDYDTQAVSVCPVVTGYDLELEATAGSQQLLLNINLLAQCIIFGNHQITVLEDAYCTRGELQPQWKEYAMDSCLDRQVQQQAIRQHIPGNFQEILDTCVLWNYPIQERQDGKICIRAAATIRILGYDEQGNLSCVIGHTELSNPLPLAEHASCQVSVIPFGETYTMPAADGTETRCSVHLQIACFAADHLRTLCGGEITSPVEDQPQKPTVIIRTLPKDMTLWEIAKKYRATEAGIRTANHLEGERLPEDMLLLLPVG